MYRDCGVLKRLIGDGVTWVLQLEEAGVGEKAVGSRMSSRWSGPPSVRGNEQQVDVGSSDSESSGSGVLEVVADVVRVDDP